MLKVLPSIKSVWHLRRLFLHSPTIFLTALSASQTPGMKHRHLVARPEKVSCSIPYTRANGPSVSDFDPSGFAWLHLMFVDPEHLTWADKVSSTYVKKSVRNSLLTALSAAPIQLGLWKISRYRAGREFCATMSDVLSVAISISRTVHFFRPDPGSCRHSKSCRICKPRLVPSETRRRWSPGDDFLMVLRKHLTSAELVGPTNRRRNGRGPPNRRAEQRAGNDVAVLELCTTQYHPA